MIKDIFYTYKMKYLKYIILIKSGNFYIALADDAKILNNVLGYQIKEFSNTVKVGFPIISLNKVIDKLDSLKINYMVIDNNVSLKRKFNKNHYDKFLIKRSNKSRISDINQKLLNMEDGNIDILLTKIEGLIWKIIY